MVLQTCMGSTDVYGIYRHVWGPQTRIMSTGMDSVYRHVWCLQTCIIIIIVKKKIGNTRPGEGDCHPISPKTPAPHYQPIEEKKRKGK